MNFTVKLEVPETTPTDPLSREYGWEAVRQGLGRILLGYMLLVGSPIVILGFLIFAIGASHTTPSEGHHASAEDLAALWAFFLGAMVLLIIILFAYSLILTGQWQCLMNAADRHGA